MADAVANIMVGKATVSVSDYIAAGAAGTFTDVGHTKTPAALSLTKEDFEVKSEKVAGTLVRFPVDQKMTLKFHMSEASAENMRVAFGQPAANKTGKTPDFTLLFGSNIAQEHQLQVVTIGPGATKVRTLLLWKCVLESVAEIQFGKGIEQLYEVTVDCLHDETVATSDKFGKQVDT